MKFFHKAKDGGSESNVTGYWLIEWKGLFSIALLRFSKGSREAFHSHAFNAISWIIKGRLKEEIIEEESIFLGPSIKYLEPSLVPIYTAKSRVHRVHGLEEVTWALTFRGPWDSEWYEVLRNKVTFLTHGRKVVTTVYGSNNSVNTTIINVNDTKKTYSDH